MGAASRDATLRAVAPGLGSLRGLKKRTLEHAELNPGTTVLVVAIAGAATSSPVGTGRSKMRGSNFQVHPPSASRTDVRAT